MLGERRREKEGEKKYTGFLPMPNRLLCTSVRLYLVSRKKGEKMDRLGSSQEKQKQIKKTVVSGNNSGRAWDSVWTTTTIVLGSIDVAQLDVKEVTSSCVDVLWSQ